MSTRELILLAIVAVCVTAAYIFGNHLTETQFVGLIGLVIGYLGKVTVTSTSPEAKPEAKSSDWTPGP